MFTWNQLTLITFKGYTCSMPSNDEHQHDNINLIQEKHQNLEDEEIITLHNSNMATVL